MLRSRTKTTSTNSQGANQTNQHESKRSLKQYGSTIAQICSVLLLICILGIGLRSQKQAMSSSTVRNAESMNDNPSEDINTKQEIANELQNINIEPTESNNNNDDDKDTTKDDNITFENLPEDSCEWRSENLVGACFGLHFVTPINSVLECKKSCCDDPECVTWQYHPTKGCQNGGNVRFGLEHAKTSNWCEPTMPQSWEGKRLKDKTEIGDNPQCEWGDDANTQCFGLGPKQPDIDSKEKCAELCCNDKIKDCKLWQWRDDKGCFIGKSNNCDGDVLSYIGQRKVYSDK